LSINGIRRPASAAPPPPHAAPGDAGATPKRAPDPAMPGAQPTELSDRPPQRASEAAMPRRIALARLGHTVGTVPGAAQAIAAKVCSDVHSGKVTLLASHSETSLSAAAAVASRGLMALARDLSPRGQ